MLINVKPFSSPSKHSTSLSCKKVESDEIYELGMIICTAEVQTMDILLIFFYLAL